MSSGLRRSAGTAGLGGAPGASAGSQKMYPSSSASSTLMLPPMRYRWDDAGAGQSVVGLARDAAAFGRFLDGKQPLCLRILSGYRHMTTLFVRADVISTARSL